jgi:hypothetical protein
MSSKQSHGASKSMNKKMSLVMRNIDYNAYRGLKLSSETSENHKIDRKELVRTQLHTTNGSVRFPFGLTETRFRWQTNKNIGEQKELNGKMVRRYSGMSSNGDWESFIQKTQDIPDTIHVSKNRASSYKFSVERNTKRTILPENDFDVIENLDNKKKNDQYKKSSAVGGISDLLDKTPLNEAKYKKYSARHLESNEIFSPLTIENKMKMSIPVNIEKIKLEANNAGNFKQIHDYSMKDVSLKLIYLILAYPEKNSTNH